MNMSSNSPGKRTKSTNKLLFPLIVVGAFILAVLIGAFVLTPFILNMDFSPSGPFQGNEPPVEEPTFTDIELICVGDILPHIDVFNAAKKGTDYNFNPQFIHVKPIIEKADIAIANLETSLAGPERKYSGYPTFNCPDAIVDALKETGFNVLINANNHCMDQGQDGFYRTLDTVRSRGLDLTGTRKTEDEKPYLIKNVKGIQVAIINFGWATTTASGVNVNGLPMPASMKNLLNYIDYSRLSSELSKLETLVTDARADGADVIVACMHWGNEYETKSAPPQKQAAQFLADLDVDIIFGGHPHVLQEADYLSSQNSDHQTLVYYSLGNFISNQRQETLTREYGYTTATNTEHGLIAQVTLRHHKDGRNEIIKSGYTATWVNKKSAAAAVFEITPANAALDNPGDFPHITQADQQRLLTCQKSVDTLMTALKAMAPLAVEN
ncbi:MAG: CapA family protein [Peptococcaceae bacterium]|nr:CapA family protein [Peptococcaceae bacterium]